MTAKKSSKDIPFPPRGLRLGWAAPYVGLGRSKFLQEVEAGRMPAPASVGRCKIWDRHKLDHAMDGLFGVDVDFDVTHAGRLDDEWDGVDA